MTDPTQKMKMSHDQIRAAHRAIEAVKSIDKNIESFGEEIQSNIERGEAMRRLLGSNRLGHFTNEHLGNVVLCAVINALLDKRTEIIFTADQFTDFPPPPCPLQIANDRSQ